MLKIRVRKLGMQTVLAVEGHLAGMNVAEVERCWRLLDVPGAAVLEIQGIVHIDRAGRCLLRTMCREGVGFAGAGLAVQDVLNEIAEALLAEPNASNCD